MLGCLRSFARTVAAQACRQDHIVLLQVRGTCSRALIPRAPFADTRLPARLASQSSTPRVLDHALITAVKPFVSAHASQLGWHGNIQGFASHLGLVAFSTTAAASQNGTAAEAAQAAEDVLAFYKDTPSREDAIMPPEERAYWEDVLKHCRKDSCIVNIRRLAMEWRLGLNPNFKAKEKPNCYDVMLKGKVRHPDAVILVQVGSFYECAGIDAIILAEWCGLNFMGGATVKAGLPLDNVHVVLGQLRQRGLQIALYEEDGDMPGGKTKYRRFTQLVNAENPVYLYNYAEGSRDLDMVAPAICGLSITSRGLTALQYIPLSGSVVVHEGLTVDAAWGYCNFDRSTTPVVYLHRPHDATPQQLKQLADVQKRFAPGTVQWRSFTAYDAEDGFKGAVLKNKGLPADTHLEVKRRDWSAGINGVRPLYYSTVMQLGLVEKGAGVLPSLLDALLPDEVRKINRDALLNLLTCPPPYHVAMSVRQAIRLLMASNTPLPGFCQRGLTPSKLLLVLDAQEGNAPFFQGLYEDLRAVAQVLRPDRTPVAADLVDAAWPLLLHTTNQPSGSLTQGQVLEAVEATLRLIKDTVAPASMGQRKRGSSGSADSSIDDSGSGAAGKHPTKSSRAAKDDSFTTEDAMEEADAVFDQLYEDNMLWDERVRIDKPPAAMKGVIKEWTRTTDHLVNVLRALLWTAHREARGKALLNKLTQPILVYYGKKDKHSAICLRLRSESIRKALAGPLQLQPLSEGMQLVDLPPQQLRRPVEAKRKGSASKPDAFTCDALEEALVDFQDVTSRANSEATAVLKQLAADLSAHKVELHAALTLGVLLSTLAEHSRAASAAGWSLPFVGAREQQEAGVEQPQSGSSSSNSSSSGGLVTEAVHDGVLQLRQLWPFWMSGSDSSTVKNDICGNTMMLLTGPNMAGKSTVLRAVAAAALAGSVGLAIPAERGSCLPLLDAVMLRTFSGDAPQEGLSAYGVEMTEMATVVADALPSSLVLIDELGKGTEVVSGTALAAGILQNLAHKHVMGVFATHLHLLVPMLAKAQVPNIEPYRMEVVLRDTPGGEPAADGSCSNLYQLKPTWRLLPGHCFESLAFSVARDCGLPEGVLRASEEYYSRIMQGGHMSGAAYDLIVQVAQAANSSSDISSISTRSAIDVSSTAAAASCSGNESWSDGDSSGDESGQGAAAPADVCDHDGQQQPEQATPTRQRHGRLMQLGLGVERGSSDSSSSRHNEVPYDLDAARVSVHKLFEEIKPQLLTPSPAEAALNTAEPALNTAEPALNTAAADAGAGASLRRRRRKGTGVQQPQQQQQQQAPEPLQQQRSGSSDLGAVEYGVVCELLPGMLPPALHEGQSVLYMLYTQDAWWYGGETQEVRDRLKTHRKSKRFAQPITMWYVVLHPGVNRKVAQGWMIREAERLGMRLHSNCDASMARRK